VGVNVADVSLEEVERVWWRDGKLKSVGSTGASVDGHMDRR